MIDVICMIPGKMLNILKTDTLLSSLFDDISISTFNTIMVEVMTNMMSDHTKNYSVLTMQLRNIIITNEHKQQWVKCFETALNQLEIRHSERDKLVHNMAFLIDLMISDRLKEVIEKIENKIRFKSAKETHEILLKISKQIDNIRSERHHLVRGVTTEFT